MKKNYLKILLVWISIGIITTTYLYLYYYNGQLIPVDTINYNISNTEYWYVSLAVTLSGSLLVMALGIKKPL